MGAALALASVAGVGGVVVDAAPAQAACTITQPLRWGARGPEVRCLEQTLVDLGSSVAGPDEYYGMSTAVAVRAFQVRTGLRLDGMVSAETAAALGIWAGPSGDVPVGRGVDTSLVQTRTIGTSVQGRPIVAIERGTPGGTPVLVVGVIHGDEDEGARIVDKLRSVPVPPGVDLWLVPTINPDGTALGRRQNARGVDLNRNFPKGWAPLGTPGYWQYGGPSAASEPETQAMVAFMTELKPAITIWYHQDVDVVSPGGPRPEVYTAYADIVRQKVDEVTGGTYTGTATQFTNSLRPDSAGFIVELPGRVPGTMVLRHATAVLAVSQL